MMMWIGSNVRRTGRLLRRWWSAPQLRAALEGCGYFLGGLILSAASLAHTPLPLPLGLLCAAPGGWPSLLLSLGSILGYRLFWGAAGLQGLVWTGAGLVVCLALGGRHLERTRPLLLPSLAALTVAVTGLIFQLLHHTGPAPWLYLLQTGLAFGSAKIAAVVLHRRDPVMDWLACALAVLALAQIAPIPQLDLGMLAAGMLAVAAPFPATALAGLALDLAQITATPMTAVLSLSFLVRLIPRLPKWMSHLAPAAMYLVVAPLCGVLDPIPAIALGAGGILSGLLPPQTPISHRRGETGMAQVRLELTAEVLSEAEQLLLEVQDYPIDEAALIIKAAARACSSCPCRKGCKDTAAAQTMPVSVLHRPLIGTEDLPVHCRKPGRLLLEIRRSQDQFRSIRADRDRQREYRNAMIQQYRFLSEYLQDLSDSLPRRGESLLQRFDVQVAARSNSQEDRNGDKCAWFAGTLCRYYVVLCDGMGTGEAAAQEGRTAVTMLRRLLTAGWPAEHALRGLNSLCALRSRGGAVTVDLTEINLQNGKTSLYKWGAAPSYLLTRNGPEKIGTAAPPPGLSVTGIRETVDKLSLRRGETLILLSDGVDGEAAMRRAGELTCQEPGEMASKVLRYGRGMGPDDATAAVIRLTPVTL